MRWFGVDGAREYLSNSQIDPKTGTLVVTRKQIYNMVSDGMKVGRKGSTGRGLMFAAELIDEYLLNNTGRKPSATVIPITDRKAS
jgi:hypothetical protein